MSNQEQGEGTQAELVDLFVVASRALVGLAVRSIESAPIELSVPGFRVLVVLDSRGPQPIGALAAGLGVHPSNASRLCTRLDGLGLTARSRGAGDGRVVEVSLTRKGHDLVSQVMDVRRAEITGVLDRMDIEDTAAAVAALEAFARATDEPLRSWSDPWIDVADASPGRDA